MLLINGNGKNNKPYLEERSERRKIKDEDIKKNQRVRYMYKEKETQS